MYNKLSSVPYQLGSKVLTRKEEAVEKEVDHIKKDKRYVKTGKIFVSGGLSKEVIRKVLQEYIKEIQRCYLKSSLRGKIVIRLIINSSGKAKIVNVISSELKDRNAEKYIVRQIKKWQFPVTKDGRETKASVSFIFEL